jgi:hypothetical protein
MDQAVSDLIRRKQTYPVGARFGKDRVFSDIKNKFTQHAFMQIRMRAEVRFLHLAQFHNFYFRLKEMNGWLRVPRMMLNCVNKKLRSQTSKYGRLYRIVRVERVFFLSYHPRDFTDNSMPSAAGIIGYVRARHSRFRMRRCASFGNLQSSTYKINQATNGV